MFRLDQGDHRPLYMQIRERLRELIMTGALSEGERIPSVRELASGLAINPNTIQKAYKELELEGWIYSVPAKGSFVSPAAARKDEARRAELLAALEKTARELRYLGLSREEAIEKIEKIYSEEGNS